MSYGASSFQHGFVGGIPLVSPDRTAEIFRRPQGLVSGDHTSGDGLPRLRVPAGRMTAWVPQYRSHHGTCTSHGPVSDDAADLLACRALAEQVGAGGSRRARTSGAAPLTIADGAPGDLNGSHLQCFLVDAELDPAP